MSDVDLSRAEDSLLLPVNIPASRSSKERSVGTKRGDWEAKQLNSEVNTSLAQGVFQVFDVVRLVLIRGG